jgi:dTDP-glucose pyrophosphorylase/CBS domain-containing protein
MEKPDKKQRLDNLVISPDATIEEALTQLDRAGTGALVLCTDGMKFYGLLTDGDVRRAMMRSLELNIPCGTIANRSPIISPEPLPPAEALRLMDHHSIDQLPVVDSGGVLQSFLLRDELITEDGFRASARQRLERVLISPSASISEAIAKMDKAGTGALILCTENLKLCGLVTDGDIRRAYLSGISMDTACEKIATGNPLTLSSSVSSRDALRLMNEHDINHLPVIDEDGYVLEFRLRKDIVKEEQIDLSAVIMAGGYGKRLLPLTEQVPKPMLPVGDKPLLELTIEQLRRSGIRDMNLTTHYLPDNIVEHFGDGNAFGVRLNYAKEDHPLGTAGGLKLLKKPDGPFLVINGDILTGVSFQEMLLYHRKNHAEITVGVRKYEVKVPFGVVDCEDVRVTHLREKPSLTFFINAGIYILDPLAWDTIPEGQRFDMTDLIQKLLDEGRTVVSFPIIEYWLDVGRHEDYQQAQDDVRNGRILPGRYR